MPHGAPTDPLDAQQTYVGNMLLPYACLLRDADHPMVELPYALYDVIDKMMLRIVSQTCGKVAKGKIALVGGIQINTSEGMSD